MKDQWIEYLQEYIARVKNAHSSTNELVHSIASYEILLPFAPAISNDTAFENISNVIVSESIDVMCYNAFVRSHKVDALLDGGEGLDN